MLGHLSASCPARAENQRSGTQIESPSLPIILTDHHSRCTALVWKSSLGPVSVLATRTGRRAMPRHQLRKQVDDVVSEGIENELLAEGTGKDGRFTKSGRSSPLLLVSILCGREGGREVGMGLYRGELTATYH